MSNLNIVINNSGNIIGVLAQEQAYDLIMPASDPALSLHFGLKRNRLELVAPLFVMRDSQEHHEPTVRCVVQEPSPKPTYTKHLSRAIGRYKQVLSIVGSSINYVNVETHGFNHGSYEHMHILAGRDN